MDWLYKENYMDWLYKVLQEEIKTATLAAPQPTYSLPPVPVSSTAK